MEHSFCFSYNNKYHQFEFVSSAKLTALHKGTISSKSKGHPSLRECFTSLTSHCSSLCGLRSFCVRTQFRQQLSLRGWRDIAREWIYLAPARGSKREQLHVPRPQHKNTPINLIWEYVGRYLTSITILLDIFAFQCTQVLHTCPSLPSHHTPSIRGTPCLHYGVASYFSKICVTSGNSMILSRLLPGQRCAANETTDRELGQVCEMTFLKWKSWRLQQKRS